MEPIEDNPEEVTQVTEDPTLMSDLRDRVKSLEKQMRRLRMDFDSFRLTLASKGVITYDSIKPMKDPGIEYHPLDNK